MDATATTKPLYVVFDHFGDCTCIFVAQDPQGIKSDPEATQMLADQMGWQDSVTYGQIELFGKALSPLVEIEIRCPSAVFASLHELENGGSFRSFCKAVPA